MVSAKDRPPENGVGPSMSLPDRLDALVGAFDRIRDRPVVSIVAAIALAGVAAIAWWSGQAGTVAPVEARIPVVTSAAPADGVAEPGADGRPDAATALTEPTEPTELLVHVAGAVRRPGIVSLDPGARIGDAVNAAGGPTGDADVHQLNLAAPVVDGLQVRVPIEGESVPPAGLAPRGGSVDGSQELVDLNRANEADLETLPGIGPALATAIVEWRATSGPFATVDDLLDVPGIGPAKLDRLADLVSV